MSEDKDKASHNAPPDIWLGLKGKSWEWDGVWSIRPFPINDSVISKQYIRVDLVDDLCVEARAEGVKAMIEEAKAAQIRVGASGNCYDSPKEANSIATFIVAALERAADSREGESNG